MADSIAPVPVRPGSPEGPNPALMFYQRRRDGRSGPRVVIGPSGGLLLFLLLELIFSNEGFPGFPSRTSTAAAQEQAAAEQHREGTERGREFRVLHRCRTAFFNGKPYHPSETISHGRRDRWPRGGSEAAGQWCWEAFAREGPEWNTRPGRSIALPKLGHERLFSTDPDRERPSRFGVIAQSKSCNNDAKVKL